MYKNGMQTTAHWSKKNLMANLLAASRTWPFLAWSSYGALTYCYSPAKSKTIHAPRAIPEIDLWLKCTNVHAAGDSQSPPHWPGEGHSPTGHLVVRQDTLLLAWDTHPVQLCRALDNSCSHGHTLQSPGAKPEFRWNPLKTVQQLTTHSSQYKKNNSCTTWSVAHVHTWKYKKGASEDMLRRRRGGWALPRKGAYSSFCLIAFASCLS